MTMRVMSSCWGMDAGKTLDMDPNFPETHHSVAMLYLHFGKIEAAISHVQQGITLSDGAVRMRCHLAYLKAVSGCAQEAQSQLQELLGLAESRYVSPPFFCRGCIWVSETLKRRLTCWKKPSKNEARTCASRISFQCSMCCVPTRASKTCSVAYTSVPRDFPASGRQQDYTNEMNRLRRGQQPAKSMSKMTFYQQMSRGAHQAERDSLPRRIAV